MRLPNWVSELAKIDRLERGACRTRRNHWMRRCGSYSFTGPGSSKAEEWRRNAGRGRNRSFTDLRRSCIDVDGIEARASFIERCRLIEIKRQRLTARSFSSGGCERTHVSVKCRGWVRLERRAERDGRRAARLGVRQLLDRFASVAQIVSRVCEQHQSSAASLDLVSVDWSRIRNVREPVMEET